MEPVSVDGTDVLNLPGQTLTNPQSINAYLDALRFTRELKRTHRVLWEDGEHHVFYLAKFNLPEAKKVWLCNCKHSKNPPFCDGSHKAL
jgi:CDGSH-type Zn-finger protein